MKYGFLANIQTAVLFLLLAMITALIAYKLGDISGGKRCNFQHEAAAIKAENAQNAINAQTAREAQARARDILNTNKAMRQQYDALQKTKAKIKYVTLPAKNGRCDDVDVDGMRRIEANAARVRAVFQRSATVSM